MTLEPPLRDTQGRVVTARLRLRQWTDADRAPFRALHRDVRAMADSHELLFDDQSDRRLDAMHAFLGANGIGLWAVERLADHAWIGLAGIQPVFLGVPLDGAAELRVRLQPRWWNHGYATEASAAAMWLAFNEHALPRVVGTTHARNDRAIALAARLGMTRDEASNFDHPGLAPGHPLRPTIVFARDKPLPPE